MSVPDSESISVVIPTFNDVGHLGDALSSIVNQTLAPAEIVVSDDGSDDGTEEFVRDFADRQAAGTTIRYVRMPSRSGVTAARNAGIAHTRGEWIATCDSDDTWVPTKLARQTSFFSDWKGRQRLVLLGTHGYNMNDAKKVISVASVGPTSEEQFDNQRENGRRVLLMHSSIMFSRADYLAVGGYTTEYGWADDSGFFNKMADLGAVVAIPEPLIYYRKRAGSVSIARFWDVRQGASHQRENQRRRANGQSPISKEQFEAELAAQPLRVRLRRRRHVWAKYYYHVGAQNMVNRRRVQGALQLTLAGIMNAPLVWAGMRNVLRTRRYHGSGAP
jgi:glycosyltransferase involved in cell wall biosynthesis